MPPQGGAPVPPHGLFPPAGLTAGLGPAEPEPRGGYRDVWIRTAGEPGPGRAFHFVAAPVRDDAGRLLGFLENFRATERLSDAVPQESGTARGAVVAGGVAVAGDAGAESPTVGSGGAGPPGERQRLVEALERNHCTGGSPAPPALSV